MMEILTAMRRLARRTVTRYDAVAAPKSTTTVTTDSARVDVQVRRFGRVFLVIGRERSIVWPPPIITVQIGINHAQSR